LKHVEHNEQVKFVQRVRHLLHDLIIFAVPNGGQRHKLEAIRLKAEGVLAGVPDLVIAEPMLPYHGLFIEMKKPGGRTAANQKELMKRLSAKNYKCVVAYSADEAWEELMIYLNIGTEFYG